MSVNSHQTTLPITALGDTVAVTGASGFIGRVVCRKLRAAGYRVRPVVRERETESDVVVPELSEMDVNSPALEGITAIVHLAALTHSAANRGRSADAAFRTLNVEVTRNLAVQAVTHGMRAFVFMSSIKVNGESSVTPNGEIFAFSPDHAPAPLDLYGRTKLEAEDELFRILARDGVSLTVLRPPLVYGPEQKANILALMHWIRRGIPLPFANVANQRSLIYVENLADAVVAALAGQHGQACYTLADVTVSTPQLLQALAVAMRSPLRMVPAPAPILRLGAHLPVIGSRLSRLCGSLKVDSSKITRDLEWAPRVSFENALEATADWYRSSTR